MEFQFREELSFSTADERSRYLTTALKSQTRALNPELGMLSRRLRPKARSSDPFTKTQRTAAKELLALESPAHRGTSQSLTHVNPPSLNS